MWARAHSEMVEERRGVGGVVGDAHGRGSVGAADPTPLVVPDELIAVGERGFRHERQEAVREHGTDEQHRFARSDHLIFQLDAIDLCVLHRSSSFASPELGPCSTIVRCTSCRIRA